MAKGNMVGENLRRDRTVGMEGICGIDRRMRENEDEEIQKKRRKYKMCGRSFWEIK